MLAVHPAGPDALVGVDGKKNPPGTHAYQSDPIGDVVALLSLIVKVY